MRNQMVLASIVLALSIPAGAAQMNTTWSVADACTPSERWSFPSQAANSIDSGTDALFQQSISKSSSEASRNAALLAVTRLASSTKNSDTWAFAQYWVGRLLFQEGLLHAAHESFENFIYLQLRSSMQSQGLAVQSAAFECLSRITAAVPTLRTRSDLPIESLRTELRKLPVDRMVMIQDAALDLIDQSLSSKDQLSSVRLNSLLGLFRAGSSHDILARGLIAAKAGRLAESILALRRFTSFPRFTSPFLEAKRDLALSLLAQQAYTTHDYELAATTSRQISKDSNWIIPALSTLAWSYQRLGNHSGALGTGYGMMSSAVKNTYAPETPLIMTISFYEMCRYSQAHGSLQAFRRDYRTSYQWLKNYYSNPSRKSPYQLAIGFIKDKNSLPERIGTELVRSLPFLSPQSEINLIHDSKAVTAVSASSFPFWNAAIVRARSQFASREQELVGMINQGLNRRMKQMMLELDEFGINAEVLEAETLRRAGDDLIWQHLNPDFYALAQSQKGSKTRPKGTFWDFGEKKTQDLTKGELWQDELGSYLAESSDLCTPRKTLENRPSKTASL